MFWQVLGETLPLAFAVIISPLPLVAVITLSLGPRGRAATHFSSVGF